MLKEEILEKRIVLDACNLNKDFRKHLVDKLKAISLNSCTKENGHILEIRDITKITDNYISNVNSEIIFIVEFKALVLKPEIGSIITDKVCMVFGGGLLLNVKDKFKVLVPANTLVDYVYGEQPVKSFTNKVKGVVIGENQECKVKITGIRFLKKNFSCIGQLIE